MRIVIQRVKKAKVIVDQKLVGQIGQGLLVLFGVGEGDKNIKNKNEKIKKLSEKILKLRIFENKAEKFDRSLLEIKGEILVVPQFTLFADCSAGNRPYFGQAAKPEVAKKVFEKFVEELKKSKLKLETGIFGAKMEVELVNDGPMTIILDSK